MIMKLSYLSKNALSANIDQIAQFGFRVAMTFVKNAKASGTSHVAGVFQLARFVVQTTVTQRQSVQSTLRQLG
jgi:hypothetical protein